MEEWNEYGELKEHVGPGAVAPGMASSSTAPSTPSKAPPSIETPTKIRFSADTPTKASQTAATNSPITMAMRQAGLDAAKKASDAKSQARAKVLGASESSNDAVKKLDNSTTPGVPPPSGTTEAASSVPLETSSTIANSTVDDARTVPKSVAEPAKGSGVTKKEISDTDSIVESGSEIVSDGGGGEIPAQADPKPLAKPVRESELTQRAHSDTDSVAESDSDVVSDGDGGENSDQDAKVNHKLLAEPVKESGLTEKGNSGTDSIAERDSDAVSDEDEGESPDQDSSATQIEPRDRSSGEEENVGDSEISASREVTNKEKPTIGYQDLIKAAGGLGLTGGPLLDHTKLETKSTTDTNQAKSEG